MGWQIWFVAAMLLFVILHRIWQRRGVEHVSVHEVKSRLDAKDQVTLVDVRQPWEYSLGHIPGAVNIPLGDLEEGAQGWDPTSEVILICRSGGRGMTGYRKLKRRGFTNVRNMEGGMMRWPWPVQKQD